ncbi:MAG TPA: tetratricopeptide repeat protein [bacterium]|nr:tetratricopeptide repeat protein [bacterium]HPN43603.1 tetratricopeptide repeat protein [bacterium]
MKLKVISLIIIILLFALLSGCAYYNTFYNAKKFYSEGEKERKKREKNMLVELSAEEKAARKKSGEATSGTLASSTEMQSYQKAIERASRVLEFYPKSKYVDDALLLLGKCFYYRREFKKAQRKFEEIIRLYPDSKDVPEARLLMAKTFLGLEEFDEAEERFRLLSQDTKIEQRIVEEARFELGGLYFEQQNYELAAENYASTAKEADDKLISAMSLYRLGECYMNLERYSEAPAIFNKAAKESPNEDFKSQALYKLGEAQSLNEQYDEAIKTFSTLLSIEYEATRIPGIKLALAENLRKKGDLAEAQKWYDNIIEEHKRTDASAKSYYALGEIEQFINNDYKKAKDNYDLVRAEFSNSAIAPEAKLRTDNIRLLLDLREEIAKLEGRWVEKDTLNNTDKDGNGGNAQELKDDGPIDLSMDGMWVNYSGRDRPPPKSLTDLSEADLQRVAKMNERLQENAASDSTAAATPVATQPVELDSAAIALAKEKEARQKAFTLTEKRLALAEVLFYNFNKPDSAIVEYNRIVTDQIDTALTTRALYSLGYLYKEVLKDSITADSVLHHLIAFNPDTPQADGARKMLGIPLVEDKVDSAAIYFKMAENEYLVNQNVAKALEIYNSIAEHYPNSDYTPKSIYAQGWLAEKKLFNPEMALQYYEKVVEKYPDSEYGKTVKNHLALYEKAKKDIAAREKALADSLANLEKAKQDSLTVTTSDSVQKSLATDSTQISQSDSTGIIPAPENPRQPAAGRQKAPDPDAEADTAKTDNSRRAAARQDSVTNKRGRSGPEPGRAETESANAPAEGAPPENIIPAPDHDTNDVPQKKDSTKGPGQ